MSYQVKQSGYIGILLILLGTVGMLFFFMKVYFTPTPSSQGISPAVSTTQFDRLQSNIGTAKAISNQVNQKSLETNRLLNTIQ